MELRQPLFTRTTGGTRLTAAGEAFVADARRIVALIEHAQRRVREFAAGRTGRLTIGICEGLCDPKFSRLLSEYRAEHPQVDVRVIELSFARQLQELESGVLDVAFALAAPDEPYLQAGRFS